MSVSRATNADGTPFYANLHARSSVRVSLSEAYTLAAQTRAMAKVMTDVIATAGTLPERDIEEIEDAASRLRERAFEIERIIDADKLRQWAEYNRG